MRRLSGFPLLVLHRLNQAVDRVMSNLRVVLLTMAVIFLTLGGLLLVESVRKDYDETISKTAMASVGLAQLFEEHTRRSLDGTDLLLRRVVEEVEFVGARKFSGAKGVSTRLQGWSDSLPQVRNIWVIGPNGDLIASADKGAAEQRARQPGDQEIFEAHSYGEREALIVPPGPLYAGGNRIFTFSRRISTSKGEFGGIAVAAVDLAHFRAFYDGLGLDPLASVGIYLDDGRPLVHAPIPSEDAAIAAAYSLGLEERLAKAPEGVVIGASLADGVQRAVAYRRVEGLPLVVTAGVPLNAPLNAWRERSMRAGVLFLGGAAVIGILGLIGFRAIGRDEDGRRELRHEAAFTQAIIESLTAQVAILDGDGRITGVNRAWRDANAKLGIGDDYVSHCRALFGDEAAGAAAEGIRRVMLGEIEDFALDYPVRQGGRSDWLSLHVTLFAGGGKNRLVVTHQDVTNIVLAQQELHESQERLIRSENLYRAIAANLPNGAVLLFDAEQRYLFADGRGIAGLGWAKKGDVVGCNPFEAHRAEIAETLARAYALALDGEEVQIQLDSGKRCYSINAIPLRDEQRGGVYAGLALAQDVTKMTELTRKLEAMTLTDGMLDIANRRSFDNALAEEWKRASRQRSPLAVLMIDVDFFKIYNDSYGHQMGDDCLRRVAGAIKDAVKRPADLVARYGGEEMAVLLPDTTEDGAKKIAEDIRKSVAKAAIPHKGSTIGKIVSVSIGAAIDLPDMKARPEDLLEKADKALYRSKEQGRNRVTFFQAAQ